MKKLALLFVALVATSCSSPSPRIDPIVLDYRNESPLVLKVDRLDIVNRAATYPSRQVSLPFKPTVTDAVNQWARDRIQADGSAGAHATLIIKDASASAQNLPIEGGIENWFTRQQSHKYLAKVEVDIEVRSADGRENSFATAHATRTATLPEDPTDYERNKAYTDILTAMMHDFDQGMEISMRQHLGSFLKSGY
jgi:hypothetical protein